MKIPTKHVQLMAALCLALAMTGCGGTADVAARDAGSDAVPASAGPTSSAAATSMPGVDLPSSDYGPDSFGDFSRHQRRYVSEDFEVSFSIVVPPGWTVKERDANLVQLWQGRSEELSNGELTLSTDIRGPADAAARVFVDALRGTQSSGPRNARYGPYSVLEIDARGVPNGLPGGYRLPPDGQARIVIFGVGDLAVTAYLDPFAEVESRHQAERTMATLGEILQTIRLGPPRAS